MLKKYVVRLTRQERHVLEEVIRKLNGSSLKVRRAQILLKADADGPNWTDQRIADAFNCPRKSVGKPRPGHGPATRNSGASTGNSGSTMPGRN